MEKSAHWMCSLTNKKPMKSTFHRVLYFSQKGFCFTVFNMDFFKDFFVLNDSNPDSQWFNHEFKFDFSFVNDQNLKFLLQDYVKSNFESNSKSVKVLYDNINNLKFFIEFLQLNNINSLDQMNQELCIRFKFFLGSYLSPKKNNLLKESSQRIIFNATKSFYQWCQLAHPDDVTQDDIFKGISFDLKAAKTPFIPNDIKFQIDNALKHEPNIFLKNGLIILEETGMRCSDLLNLKIDCINDGQISFTQMRSKNTITLQASERLISAVNELIEQTVAFRDTSPYLMIRMRNGQPSQITNQTFSYDWLKKFSKDHQIKDSNGEIYNLTGCQFRTTLANDMVEIGKTTDEIKSALGLSTVNNLKELTKTKTSKQKSYVEWTDIHLDIWDLRPYIVGKSIKDSQKFISFEYISNEKDKLIIKQFAQHKLTEASPYTVRNYINGSLPMFVYWLEDNGLEIENAGFDEYIAFYEYVKENDEIKKSSRYGIYHVIEELLTFRGISIPKKYSANQLVKDDEDDSEEKELTEDQVKEIIKRCKDDEENVLTRSGILLQIYTGLRIYQVLKLKSDCLKGDYLYVDEFKIKASKEVKAVINELIEASADLRIESGLDELFLVKVKSRHNEIAPLTVANWSYRRLTKFVETWYICDDEGEFIKLTTNMLRMVFINNLIKNKTPLKDIIENYPHISTEKIGE